MAPSSRRGRVWNTGEDLVAWNSLQLDIAEWKMYIIHIYLDKRIYMISR